MKCDRVDLRADASPPLVPTEAHRQADAGLRFVEVAHGGEEDRRLRLSARVLPCPFGVEHEEGSGITTAPPSPVVQAVPALRRAVDGEAGEAPRWGNEPGHLRTEVHQQRFGEDLDRVDPRFGFVEVGSTSPSMGAGADPLDDTLPASVEAMHGDLGTQLDRAVDATLSPAAGPATVVFFGAVVPVRSFEASADPEPCAEEGSQAGVNGRVVSRKTGKRRLDSLRPEDRHVGGCGVAAVIAGKPLALG